MQRNSTVCISNVFFAPEKGHLGALNVTSVAGSSLKRTKNTVIPPLLLLATILGRCYPTITYIHLPCYLNSNIEKRFVVKKTAMDAFLFFFNAKCILTLF